MNFIDMTGWIMSEHGVPDSRWTVLYLDDEWNKNHKTNKKWVCQCNCEKHTIKSIYGNYLRNGQSKSCGCYQKDKSHERITIDMTGWVMSEHGVPNSRITVLYEDKEWSKNHNRVKWICQCNCNNKTIFSAFGTDLRNGNTTSCGCKNIERLKSKKIDMTGWKMREHGVPESKIEVISECFDSSLNDICWNCRCSCGNPIVFQVQGNHLREGTVLSCGCFGSSKGEIIIKNYLSKHKIDFIKEYSFDDLFDKKPLRFDYAIIENKTVKLLIEYQGIQHYRVGWNESEEEFKKRLKHDEMKKIYCKQNNILLYEIKYNDNIEEKLKEIFDG